MVLAGGASRRMGVDKATMLVEGRRLGDRSVDALRGAGLELVTVGGEDRLDVPHVPDAHPGAGPLGGVLSAFASIQAVDAEALVVLPCDLPRVGSSHVAGLIAAAERHPHADVVVATVGGRRAYPIGVWRRRGEVALAAAFHGGERAFGRALSGCSVVEVDLGPDLADADRPADLPATDSLPGDPLTEGGSM